MMYAVTTAPTATTGEITAGSATALVTAGTFYVWYYVKADITHLDSEIADSVTVTVTPAASPDTTVTWSSDDMKSIFLSSLASSNASSKGITVTLSGDGSFTGAIINGGSNGSSTFEFTPSTGCYIKSIVITGTLNNIAGDAPAGWTANNASGTLTWSGGTSAFAYVDLTLKQSQSISGISSVVFTIVSD